MVPDAEFILRSYLDDANALVTWRGEPGQTPMEVVNSYFRQRNEHQFLYDCITLEKLLMRAGFDAAQRTSYGQGLRCQDIVLDDPKYARESLYVEAQKHASSGLASEDNSDAARAGYLAMWLPRRFSSTGRDAIVCRMNVTLMHKYFLDSGTNALGPSFCIFLALF